MFYERLFIYLVPIRPAPKLKYPAPSLGTSSCGWLQEGVLEPLSGAVEHRGQRWDPPGPAAANSSKR